MNDLEVMNSKTMTSIEIATLTGKEHFHVLRDIRNMFKELSLEAPKTGFLERINNLELKVKDEYYNLDKELTITLVSGYSIKMRHAIIKRWQELELEAKHKPKTRLELAKENVVLIEEIESVQAELFLADARQIKEPHISIQNALLEVRNQNPQLEGLTLIRMLKQLRVDRMIRSHCARPLVQQHSHKTGFKLKYGGDGKGNAITYVPNSDMKTFMKYLIEKVAI